MVSLRQIFVYPIKSCRGFAVSSATVEPRGLARDRRYMLVDARGRFLSQRKLPRMALIGVTPEHDGYRIEAPGQTPLHLPLGLEAGRDEARECEVRLFREDVRATLAPPDVNVWFSEYLGVACGLVYQADDQHRAVLNPAAEFDDEVSFADGAPLLLLSEPSLAALNARLERPVGIERFRPNLVVTAESPHAEDAWSALAVGEAEFDVAWACSRCTVPTVDPATGELGPDNEPIATLGGYRRKGASVYFGQNLLPRRLGRIAVGEQCRVVTRTETA